MEYVLGGLFGFVVVWIVAKLATRDNSVIQEGAGMSGMIGNDSDDSPAECGESEGNGDGGSGGE